MGNLLKVLTREIENYPHFFLDFESKSGTGVERVEEGWVEEEEGVLISGILLVMEPLWTLLQLFFISAAPFCFDYLIRHTSSFLPLSFSSLSCRSQMGNLLTLLTCTELEQGPNFFLDFESELS